MTNGKQSNFENQLDQSLKYGFIHNIHYKNNLYAPKILINNPDTGEFVLSELQNELKKATSFCINVAFVTTSGIGMIKTQLADFSARGGTGKILVSPYLGFNDPAALNELLKLKNIEVRMTHAEAKSHAKVYIFNHDHEQAVIVGSSNLTHSALKLNYEWNVKLTSTDNGEFIKRTLSDFNTLWENADILTPEWIEEYDKNREKIVNTEAMYRTVKHESEDYPVIRPNNMQKEAVSAIKSLRQKNIKRALVISATGTGKTYLGAFDVKDARPERMLFLVHREQILRDAEESFKRVIGFQDDESIIYKSGDDLSDKKYVFATVQSLHRDKNLAGLAPDLFDYILMDEAHHATAPTYQKIMNHFTPEFYLGLTATPDRTDGDNIYELFHYNVAYEIRLQAALSEKMLTPFLYYGVTEMRKADGELIDEKEDFSRLVTSERVDHILEKIHYYEISSEKTRGLIFCSRKKEAYELSAALNHRGLRTVALSGDDSQDIREMEVKRLEAGELDYILTVDIFNEGIDIPSLNQIIMLRNTESSIIFVQQLGRGLRLYPDKQVVTIIDFIGNYKNNYLIPMALYGDNSFNKDNYQRLVGNRLQLEGVTSINFEEIAQEQILGSIDNTNYSSIANFKTVYEELRNRLGEIPYMLDFYRNNSIDPTIFFENNSIKHYGDIISRFEEDQKSYALEDFEYTSILQMLVEELLNGKRPHELLLLRLLIQREGSISRREYLEYLDQKNAEYSDEMIRSVERVLTLDFFKGPRRIKHNYPLIRVEEDRYVLSEHLAEAFMNKIFRKLTTDVIRTGLAKTTEYPMGYTLEALEIGKKYSRRDVARLLLWSEDESSTMYGYFFHNNQCPLFVNYYKIDDLEYTNEYPNMFSNEQLLHWHSKANRTTESKEVIQFIESNKNGTDLFLFVKSQQSKSGAHHYLGKVDYVEDSARDNPNGIGKKDQPVVSMDLTLETPVSYNLFQYLVRED